MTVSFTVIGVPQSKGSAKAFMPKGARFPIVTSDNKSLKGWEHSVRAAVQQHVQGLFFHGPVAVRITFELPRPKSLKKSERHHVKRPDLDKLARGTLDALTGPLWKDDSQVIELHVRKVYATDQPKAHVQVETVSDGLLATEVEERMNTSV